MVSLRRFSALFLWSAMLFASGAPQSAAASTFLVMRSQPGDYLGRGETYRFTDEDAAFEAQHTVLGAINFSIDSGAGSNWNVSFAPPEGSRLEPNFYDEAGNFPSQSPTKPGIAVHGAGRGCNNGSGTFYVLEVDVDPAGRVERFAADFEYHCENGATAIFGTIGFQSTLPEPEEPHVPPHGPTKTYLRLDSDFGDFIGGGVDRLLTSSDGQLTFRQSFGYLLVNFDSETDWGVVLETPSGRDLAPGFYPDARRAGFREPGEPGLEAIGNHNGCNTITGWFAIYQADFGPGNELGRFAADFEQHCEGGAPALHGSIRLNSDFPAGACPGDCNDDGEVGVDELTTGVGIALGSAPLPRCLSFDADSTSDVSVNELIAAVNAALYGCSRDVPAGIDASAIARAASRNRLR